ncbi:MAG: hypothetical protein JWL84_283 [Rhodospirillales bacterium]|nr:hypothetical protein [Rhodospirillales bacterium]
MENTEYVTVYQGTDRQLPYLRPGSWVTMAREEAVAYAQATGMSNLVDQTPGPSDRLWLLELHVRRDQIGWTDGDRDADFDGQHGTLLAKSVVIGSTPVEPGD